MNLRLVLLFVMLGVADFPSVAQPPIKDAWLWTTITLDKKLNKKFSLDLDEELRLFDNMSRMNLVFTNIECSYKLSKTIHLSLGYRFIEKNQLTYFSERHRLMLDASAHKKWKNFGFNYRLRLQGQVRDIRSSNDGKALESYMRNKFDVEYDWKKFTPYVSAEFRYQFTNPNFQASDAEYNRGRYYAGCDYKLDKDNSINLYFMLQHDYNVLNYEEDFVYGVQWTHDL